MLQEDIKHLRGMAIVVSKEGHTFKIEWSRLSLTVKVMCDQTPKQDKGVTESVSLGQEEMVSAKALK